MKRFLVDKYKIESEKIELVDNFILLQDKVFFDVKRIIKNNSLSFLEWKKIYELSLLGMNIVEGMYIFLAKIMF